MQSKKTSIKRKQRRLLWKIARRHMSTCSNYTIAFDLVYGIMITNSDKDFWDCLRATIMARKPGCNEHMEFEPATPLIRHYSYVQVEPFFKKQKPYWQRKRR